MQLFRFDREEALKSITDPDGAPWPVNVYSAADELNALVDDALTGGIVPRERPGAHFAIYPMSLSEPHPILTVDLGAGPALLGQPLKLCERDGESPVGFTRGFFKRWSPKPTASPQNRDDRTCSTERKRRPRPFPPRHLPSVQPWRHDSQHVPTGSPRTLRPPSA